MVMDSGVSKGWYTSEHINELAAALCKAQAMMDVAEKSSSNPYFQSKYANLLEIVMTARPALTANGLAMSQFPRGDELITLMMHSSGQWIESRVPIRPPKGGIQEFGSYMTYLKRYVYQAMVGLVSDDEDDDGEKAVRHHREEENEQKITKEQLDMLQIELKDRLDIAKKILSYYNITQLSDVQKSNFNRIMEKIRQQKQI
jgi:hypothetical protein